MCWFYLLGLTCVTTGNQELISEDILIARFVEEKKTYSVDTTQLMMSESGIFDSKIDT